MSQINYIEESSMHPAIVAILSGAGGVLWMLYFNGFSMFNYWFFYPSFILILVTPLSLFVGLKSRFSNIVWIICMWWSGLWSIIFILAVCVPPFSLLIIGHLVEPIIMAGQINPFLAGLLHILVWSCALEVRKLNSNAKVIT